MQRALGMTMLAETEPTPGELIQRQLEIRGWSQRMLSIVLDIGESSVTRILSGKQPVDAELAVALEGVLDLPAEQLLGLQTQRDLATARAVRPNDPDRAARARLYGELPLREMMRRGWVDASDVRDTGKIDAELARLFGVARAEDIEHLAAAGPDGLTRLAWLARVRQRAAAITAGAFSQHAVACALAALRMHTDSVEAVSEVPSLLAENGVRLVVVEALPRVRIDAACLWLDHVAPVIALSLSEDRIDCFWFLLRHQLEHVLKHESCTLPCAQRDDAEHRADDAAMAFCVPLSHLDAFIARKAPFISRSDMTTFARSLGVHPGIVAGLVQRRTGKYEGFNSLIARVRPVLAPSCVVDGWGRSADSCAHRQVPAAANAP